MADSANPKFHPVLAVNNIKTLIPITLDRESCQYHSWVALFKVQAKLHDVMDHIIPPTEPTTKAAADKAKAADIPLWNRIDAAVLQWIYATVSRDILDRILVEDDTAAGAWDRVSGMFRDNRTTRAMHLNKELNIASLADFPDTNAYCNYVQKLADQLKNIGAKLDDDIVVLRLLDGLTDSYDNFVTHIQQKKHLPDFKSIRSKLALEETTKIAKGKAEAAAAALHTQTQYTGNTGSSSGSSTRSNSNGYKGKHQKSKKNGGQSGGFQQQKSGGKGYTRSQQDSPPANAPRPAWTAPPPWWMTFPYQWAPPPCSYPTQPWPRPVGSPNGTHGPRQQMPPPPAQFPTAHMAFDTSQQWVPTEIDQAFNTMSLQQPPAPWIMDTGATSHMTSSPDREPDNEV